MREIILFFDTNKLFGLTRSWILDQDKRKSNSIIALSKTKKVYVSTFVLVELARSIEYHTSIPCVLGDLRKFFIDQDWGIVDSKAFPELIYNYVTDQYDAQILADALIVHADYLITNNLKDFNIAMIEQDFSLKVSSQIL
jgi:hypothetical protein